MQRCRSCQAVMTPTETACLSCGTELNPVAKHATLAKFLNNVINVLFWTSAGCGVLGLFWADGPPWKPSFLVALLLRLLKSSAGEMMKSQGESS